MLGDTQDLAASIESLARLDCRSHAQVRAVVAKVSISLRLYEGTRVAHESLLLHCLHSGVVKLLRGYDTRRECIGSCEVLLRVVQVYEFAVLAYCVGHRGENSVHAIRRFPEIEAKLLANLELMQYSRAPGHPTSRRIW